jgi:UDP-GlcNAc:undecaprenyl-phosphate/decaprenyl-phosphate GlcNAc-1-phosphate transferase
MLSLFLIFLSALLFAAAATPIARRVALTLGIIDQPSARKVHSTPIPLLGGVAIYAAFVAALALFGSEFYVAQLVGIFLGATFVSFLGIWDDWRGIRPLLKLGGQVFAAAILIATGVQVEFLHSPVLNVAVTALWVVGITNALNLLDNMDGLSGGVSAIAAAWFALLSIQNGQVLVAAMSVALLGAALGFLFYNFNPASIFMGDGGSLFLGFLLASVGIKLRFIGRSDEITWMVPVLVLGVPIFDTTLVVVSRLRRGVNPLTTPGRDHFSHRLVRLGLSHRMTVLAIYVIGGLLGALAFAVQFASLPVAYVVLVLVSLVAIVVLTRLEREGNPTRASPF